MTEEVEEMQLRLFLALLIWVYLWIHCQSDFPR